MLVHVRENIFFIRFTVIRSFCAHHFGKPFFVCTPFANLIYIYLPTVFLSLLNIHPVFMCGVLQKRDVIFLIWSMNQVRDPRNARGSLSCGRTKNKNEYQTTIYTR